MNERQEKNLIFAKSHSDFKNSDLVKFFNEEYSRVTITRDLDFLVKKEYLIKNGSGAQTKYSLSPYFDILREVDVEKYFGIDFQKREVQERFNFEIFDILEKAEIFSKEEQEKLENLQKEFIKNFSRYDSQTLINKEFERIMIEFSWKSSSIEGNTYSLLATEALIKENIPEIGKSKTETQMILNHKGAFNETIQNKERFKKMDWKDIEYIHSILIKWLEVKKEYQKFTGRNYGDKIQTIG